MQTRIKPCKFCESTKHYPYQCRENPKNRPENRHIPAISTKKRIKSSFKPKIKQKPLTQTQKNRALRKWFKTRKDWFAANPSDYYLCALRISKLCPGSMLKQDTTLDHIIPRSARPDLRYEFSNLQPACWPCNSEKGSKH